ncbi:zinc ribbon domain-containing protein [Haloprofundus halobius]|uniref:zinc ribbon domain-containing protein n=1 Tax=Haloprofundus halobius TaxID=2876194 RepID=UPI001CCFC2F0|nr:zinc ribbon domain-containing protein [Haloprofundus halobius]
MELLFRLLVAGFVIVAPSALFLGLWHGLHRLRDDRLVERLFDETDDAELSRGGRFVLTPTARRSRASGSVACAACGTPNPRGVRFCHDCLSKLDAA